MNNPIKSIFDRVTAPDSGVSAFENDTDLIDVVEKYYTIEKDHTAPEFAKIMEEKVRKIGAESIVREAKKLMLTASTKAFKKTIIFNEPIDKYDWDSIWLNTTNGGMIRADSATKDVIQAQADRCRKNLSVQELAVLDWDRVIERLQQYFDEGKTVGEALMSMGLIKIPVDDVINS